MNVQKLSKKFVLIVIGFFLVVLGGIIMPSVKAETSTVCDPNLGTAPLTLLSYTTTAVGADEERTFEYKVGEGNETHFCFGTLPSKPNANSTVVKVTDSNGNPVSLSDVNVSVVDDKRMGTSIFITLKAVADGLIGFAEPVHCQLAAMRSGPQGGYSPMDEASVCEWYRLSLSQGCNIIDGVNATTVPNTEFDSAYNGPVHNDSNDALDTYLVLTPGPNGEVYAWNQRELREAVLLCGAPVDGTSVYMAMPTMAPTNTIAPTNTPAPTGTAAPTNTPDATGTPAPASTATPTATPNNGSQ